MIPKLFLFGHRFFIHSNCFFKSHSKNKSRNLSLIYVNWTSLIFTLLKYVKNNCFDSVSLF